MTHPVYAAFVLGTVILLGIAGRFLYVSTHLLEQPTLAPTQRDAVTRAWDIQIRWVACFTLILILLSVAPLFLPGF
jgi:hypothetical protein